MDIPFTTRDVSKPLLMMQQWSRTRVRLSWESAGEKRVYVIYRNGQQYATTFCHYFIDDCIPEGDMPVYSVRVLSMEETSIRYSVEKEIKNDDVS